MLKCTMAPVQNETGSFALPEVFWVGEYRIHPGENHVRCEAGSIQVEPKVMSLLVYLARNAGSTITREQLFEAVWPGVVVTDDTLTQAVAKLRKAFGDDARNPRYIQTVPKNGYRLCAAVRFASAAPAVSREGAPYRRRYFFIAALFVAFGVAAVFIGIDWSDIHPAPASPLAVDGLPTLTVQPLQMLGEDPSQAYLAQGLTYDLITDLSKLSGLRVIGSRSIMGVQPDLTRTHDARYLVQGEVQRVGDQLRVLIHLVDAQSGEQIWSERFRRPAGKLFQLQEEISQQIVSAVAIEVSEEEKRRLARHYTLNIRAYEAFVRAQSLLLVRLRDENEQARQLFRQAIDLDPSFARAYGGLALSFAADFRNQWTPDGPGALQRARTMAQTALEIDPEIPEVYWVLAYVHAQQRQHEEAIGLLHTAVSLDPSFADGHALMGGIYTYIGRPRETLGPMRTAIRLNPDAGYLYYLLLGRAYFFLNHWEQAEINLLEALARNPTNLEAHIYLAAVSESAGDHEGAVWEREEILTLDADFRAAAWFQTYPMTDRAQSARLAAALKNLDL
ncbi:MAG: winged helix-turn-helix domain-containing protein [Thioalkalivibrio sp.]|nr:winged helix-turn-helix domain-containing protein [Thioalkalivibrio sp.]